MGKYFAVAIGGAAGSLARYLLGTFVGSRWPTTFPLGTLIINITGSFIIGFFLTFASERVGISPTWRLAVAVGFVGAYTTFSTFEYETFKLLESGNGTSALMNVFLSLALGFLAVWAGVATARQAARQSILAGFSSEKLTGKSTGMHPTADAQPEPGISTEPKDGSR